MRLHKMRTAGALISAVALTVALAACGSDSSNEENNGDSGSTSSSEGGDTGESTSDEGSGTEESTGTDEGSSDEGSSSEGGGGNLIVGTTDTVQTVDPANCYSYYCSNILQNAGETLVGYMPGSTVISPVLAKELPTISEDGLTYTFKLRQDVTFTDGSDMTSKDVKFSLDRALWIAHPKGASFLLGNIKSIDTPDDYTVVIHLGHADSTFASKLAYVVATIVSSDAYKSPDGPLGDGDDPDSFINSKLVATGPYTVADFRQGDSITLEAYDGYWGDAPANDKVLVKFYGKSAQLLAALKAGEVDIAFRALTPQQRTSLKDGGKFKVISGPGASIRYLVMNPKLDPVSDVKVRKAIASAMDRQRIIDDVLGGAGEPLFSMIPPIFDANKPTFKQYNDKKPSDFIGDKKIDITVHYGQNHYGPQEADLAQSIARMLNESGSFNADTAGEPWAQYTGDAWPGKTGQFPLFLLGWYPDYLDADDYASPFYTCDSFLAMYCNDDMEALIKKEQATDEPGSDARMATFAKIQDLAAEDVPLIPLYVGHPFAYAAQNVTGISDTMGPEQIFRYYMISKG